LTSPFLRRLHFADGFFLLDGMIFYIVYVPFALDIKSANDEKVFVVYCDNDPAFVLFCSD